jgi:hypothetical protein
MIKHTYINDKGEEEDISNKTIYCNLISQFGNNFFQYIYSLLLNRQLDGEILYAAKSTIWSGPSHDRPRVWKWTHEKNIYKAIPDLPIALIPQWTGKFKKHEQLALANVNLNPDLCTFKFDGRPVVLSSYFQKYFYYKPHKSFIKDCFSSLYKDPPADLPGGNDVVIHMRGRDCGWPVSEKYFLKALSYIKNFDAIRIITDDPGRFKTFSQALEQYYNRKVSVLSQNSIDDFKFILHAKKIVICGSTFSWWAAWLSEAETICMPNTSLFNKNGDKRLFVDEDRYQIF